MIWINDNWFKYCIPNWKYWNTCYLKLTTWPISPAPPVTTQTRSFKGLGNLGIRRRSILGNVKIATMNSRYTRSILGERIYFYKHTNMIKIHFWDSEIGTLEEDLSCFRSFCNSSSGNILLCTTILPGWGNLCFNRIIWWDSGLTMPQEGLIKRTGGHMISRTYKDLGKCSEIL